MALATAAITVTPVTVRTVADFIPVLLVGVRGRAAA
jgi:hypothetical protein